MPQHEPLYKNDAIKHTVFVEQQKMLLGADIDNEFADEEDEGELEKVEI